MSMADQDTQRKGYAVRRDFSVDFIKNNLPESVTYEQFYNSVMHLEALKAAGVLLTADMLIEQIQDKGNLNYTYSYVKLDLGGEVILDVSSCYNGSESKIPYEVKPAVSMRYERAQDFEGGTYVASTYSARKLEAAITKICSE